MNADSSRVRRPARAPPRRLAQEADASATVISFLIAGVIFVASISTLLLTATQSESAMAGIGDCARADSLAHVLLDSPGVAWDHDNGTVLRLGLADADGVSLNPEALASLRGAAAESNGTNRIVDYEEAKGSVGLSDCEFRIRMAPIGLATRLANMDLGGIRTAFVGSWDAAPQAEVPDGPNVTHAARQAVNGSMSDLAGLERDMLHGLGLGFDNRVHLDSTEWDVWVEGDPRLHITEAADPVRLEGDVYPDQKQFLGDSLPSRLPDYDLAVVGSDVRHETLTAGSVKEAVRDWVLAGGTLLVLGSGSQSTQWLQPLFHVGTDTVSGGAYAPEASHPLLLEPHPLAWSEYEVPPKAWEIRDQGAVAAEDDFDHVVMADGSGDLLAVSRPGSFDDGKIMLSSYRPGALANAFGSEEGTAMLHNMIVHLDRSHLYLEYGGMPPIGTDAPMAVRLSLLEDSQLGQVSVQVQVQMWSV